MKLQLNINKAFPKKSLGQNFIQSKDFILKLSKLIQSDIDTNIFEIGPGMGALTDELVKKNFKNLYLIEKDLVLFQNLKKEFKNDKNILVFNSDAIDYNYEKINKNQKSLIVGNLPFNISSQLLINWIVNYNWPPFYSKMILMFQKEVANRIIARHNQKSYSRISVISQARCEIKVLLNAPSNIFFPKPKVDGTVLEFIPTNKYLDINISNLQKILRKSFEHRRKKIKTSLKDYDYLLKRLSIDDGLRAENLSVDDYCKLALAI
ncbi:16S rRNA (adenine(1518)-N(6)/adenine(1519)-N(6))-dimethyltransferase RsmA [Pelagibacteraceae bacterium]|nr:16S rRNA (adenine(1518)-N(6)/adenine(1519)-N(6))-dimethyltransferase RsmA [Pelagibacteraceae bacterium]